MKTQIIREENIQETRVHIADSMLWSLLDDKMRKEELWRNPDLTIIKLARLLCSNRTKLSRLIHAHGYTSFQSYICEYRINAFIEFLPQNHHLSFQGLFYEVGFKSKVTALRHFRQRTGMTPTEYYKNVILKPIE
ncbi:MAG: helix-turn-helix domain-containing protein [Parabacteroides sp.]